MKTSIATGRWAGLIIEGAVMPKAMSIVWVENDETMVEMYHCGVDDRFYFIGRPTPTPSTAAPPAPAPAPPTEAVVPPSAANVGQIRDALPFDTDDLDKLAINVNDREVMIQPKCHPASSLRMRYDSQEKVALLACVECNRYVLKIRVGAPPADAMDDTAFFEAGMRRYGHHFPQMLRMLTRSSDGSA